MRVTLSAAIATLAAGTALAGDATVTIDIPRFNVAEYHRPYVAFWIESEDGAKLTNLAVWYDTKLKNDEGTKWLKDMRQWWRRTGRELTMPAEGLSSPTRAPGTHDLTFDLAAAPLKGLTPGKYQLVVEAAREVGGRELLRVPFEWPAAANTEASVKGEHEIGSVKLKIAP